MVHLNGGAGGVNPAVDAQHKHTLAMKPRARRALLLSICLLALIYLSGPFVARGRGIGNCAGPKIYPQKLHEALYIIAWEANARNEGKPRLSVVFRSEYRPWFYGMYSKNDDPVWLQAEYEKWRAKRAAGRGGN